MRRVQDWALVVLLALGIPLLLGNKGCSTDQIFAIDEPTEISIGKDAAASFDQKHHIITGTAAAERVARIGRKITAATNRPNLPWSFKVVEDSSVNAFSLPGGPVYVNSGVLDLGISDDELAGVLGHEAAHIQQRHSVKAIQSQIATAMITDVALRNQSNRTKAAVDLALTYGVELPHSRKDEDEADAVGIRISYNAAYPTDGIVNFLKRLDKLPDMPQTPEWMSDHPSIQARIERTERIAAEVGALPKPVPLVPS